MGQAQTTASVVHYKRTGDQESQTTQVVAKCIAEHTDKNMGCRDLDYLLMEWLERKVGEDDPSFGDEVRTNQKQRLRALEGIEQGRIALSSDHQGMIQIDDLREDIDFEYDMVIEEYEEIVEPVINRFKGFIDELIAKPALQDPLIFNRIHSVELCGDGMRTTAFENVLKEKFPKESEQTRVMNALEFMPKGAA